MNFMIELKCGQTVLEMKNNLAIYSICSCNTYNRLNNYIMKSVSFMIFCLQ